MSLTYSQIESLLTDGLSFHLDDKEYVARADQSTDNVTVKEMTALNRMTVPLEKTVDRAQASESGSDLADTAALRQLLIELVS